jgi:hypothetical protein
MTVARLGRRPATGTTESGLCLRGHPRSSSNTALQVSAEASYARAPRTPTPGTLIGEGMRTLTFDQFEFDPPDAEEALEISIATKRDRSFPDVVAFASAVLGCDAPGKLPPPIAFREWGRSAGVRAYLQRHASVVLPDSCNWPTYIMSDDWDDWDALIVGPDMLIRYHWWTTA